MDLLTSTGSVTSRENPSVSFLILGYMKSSCNTPDTDAKVLIVTNAFHHIEVASIKILAVVSFSALVMQITGT